MARKYGAARIRQDLKGKGVSEEIISRVSTASELKRARAILRRKYPEPVSSREEHARRARFLQGRGFSYETIRSALSSSTNFSEE